MFVSSFMFIIELNYIINSNIWVMKTRATKQCVPRMSCFNRLTTFRFRLLKKNKQLRLLLFKIKKKNLYLKH